MKNINLIIKLKKKIYLHEIIKIKKTKIFFDKISSFKYLLKNSLTFLKKNNNELIKKAKNNFIVISDNKLKLKQKRFIYSARPRLLFCKIINKLVYKNLIIFPTIEQKISKNAKIDKFAIIENNVQIGNNTIIESGAIIKKNTIIGNNCIIRSGAVIGGEGFSFERTKKDLHHMKAFGGVQIGNNVSVGINSSICKSTFDFTLIGDYSQIDTLVQVAHNTTIGKHTTITGGSQIGGSTIIGNNVWLSPCTNISNGLNIGDNVFVGIGSVVIKDIKKGNRVFGNPARKID